MLHHVEPMDPAARVQRHDGPVDSAPFEPAPAGRRPRRALQELVRVLVEVLYSGREGRDGLDVVGL